MTARIDDVPGLKTIGAQAAGAPIGFTSLTIGTLTGLVNIPNRPTSPAPTEPGVNGFFIADFTGHITGPVQVTLTLPAVSGYIPGDVIRVRLTNQTVAAFTVAVKDDGTGAILSTMPATLTDSGFVDAQLNAAATAWVRLNSGGF